MLVTKLNSSELLSVWVEKVHRSSTSKLKNWYFLTSWWFLANLLNKQSSYEMTVMTPFDYPSVAQLPADLKSSTTSSCTSTLILISHFVIETDNSALLHGIFWSPWKPEDVRYQERPSFPDNILFFFDSTNHPRHWKDMKSFKRRKEQWLLKNLELSVAVGLMEKHLVDNNGKSSN